MMTSVELKVDRDLLDYEFEGYKLSLDPKPVLQCSIVGGVERFEPDDGEYSFPQLHMSANFNQLFQDIWSPSCVFFINQRKFLTWCCLKPDGCLASPRIVWKLPVDLHQPKSNASVVFPDTEWAVVGDGNGTVYILHTPSRYAGEPWTLCHSYVLSECSSSCYLLYADYMTLPNRHQIDCILAHFSPVPNKEKETGLNSPSFICLIEWLSFTCRQDLEDWSLKRSRRLSGNSALLYVSLESSCDAIYLASEKEFKFIYDSEIPVVVPKEKEKGTSIEPPLFTYIQTPEDITVVFRLPQNANKDNVKVHFDSSIIKVSWKGTVVLEGELSNCIDCSASTWIVCDERLEIILSKQEVGQMWSELVKGNCKGEELMDPALVSEIHSHLAHLTSETEICLENSTPYNVSQLEECDSCDDAISFLRLDSNTHQETHQVNMGGRQWLFSCRCNIESVPIVCLRHDVDGLIWQPKNKSSEGELEPFKMEHISTFSALGYVQASKQDKKFVLCSPNFAFAAISDWARHVYIYCQPEMLDSTLQLRNRKTGQYISHIAKQYVVSLENCDRILGLQISNECIFVLSSQTLYAIKMCE